MPKPPPARQAGIALAVALILLLVMTLMALTGARLGTSELRMAVNDELRVEAAEQAQSVVDAVVAGAANFTVSGNVGDTACAGDAAGCTRDGLALPPDFDEDLAAGRIAATVRREGPETGPPPRGLGTSLALFGAAYFSVEGAYDRTGEGRGRGRIHQGVLVLVPKN